ncbi:PD-(D/E)XK nuclease family protein [Komagataeibacter sp. FNDCF1]|uniref:PD-(D/E)XK nuclease family protein n=1 Tax=Komagataeibacter sp. FNDCF1 TaxID=2878681 RepID=UPI00272EE735|nr:PD-(D/E)XK nuclease family protein [Komagataeibacter sp. FNDCF1]
MKRRTLIVHDRHAMRQWRLKAARAGWNGLQVMTFGQVIARLAGGFAREVDEETLRQAVQAALRDVRLAELARISTLPGMASAVTGTLRRVWGAGIDLSACGAGHPRIAEMAQIEAAVLAALPPGCLCPAEMARRACARLAHAPALLGPVEIMDVPDLSPCWRPTVQALARHVPVQWHAGPRQVPAWLDGTGITVVTTGPATPDVTCCSAATPHHEAIEAMRWARALMASGQAKPEEIAIATTSAGDHDASFLSLRADADFALHFVHGLPVTATRDGQAAAALADIVARGLSRLRLHRLVSLTGADSPMLTDLPEGWIRILGTAPLDTPDAWGRLLSGRSAGDWPDGMDHGPALRVLVDLLHRGPPGAGEMGERLLAGRARVIWRAALAAGPAQSVDLTVEGMRLDDSTDPCTSVAWMPAGALAASPRRFVRLLGLNSARWPRNAGEDRLLPGHIIPATELNPMPVGMADRQSFATIMATTGAHVVLSRARRGNDGRLLGRSALLQDYPAGTYLRRNRVPAHAWSETDRLTARRGEFARTSQARSATACWHDWLRPDITPHDGLVRADHPAMQAIMQRTQSASSLRMLLRNPLGFMWRYGLGLNATQEGKDSLMPDAMAVGNLVHATMEHALVLMAQETRPDPDRNAIAEQALAEATAQWQRENATPPGLLWDHLLDTVRTMARWGLRMTCKDIAGCRSYAEVPFGGISASRDRQAAWDTTRPVPVADTGFFINGYIDRLDIAADGRQAWVYDYKTGRAAGEDTVLKGGAELQRCLYAFAVQALLGAGVQVDATLLYLRDETILRLDAPRQALADLTGYLRAARRTMLAGHALAGPDTGGDYDDMRLALPAGPVAYRKRKEARANMILGDDAIAVWDAP